MLLFGQYRACWGVRGALGLLVSIQTGTSGREGLLKSESGQFSQLPAPRSSVRCWAQPHPCKSGERDSISPPGALCWAWGGATRKSAVNSRRWAGAYYADVVFSSFDVRVQLS